jgi:hypothetical protein
MDGPLCIAISYPFRLHCHVWPGQASSFPCFRINCGQSSFLSILKTQNRCLYNPAFIVGKYSLKGRWSPGGRYDLKAYWA